MNSFSETSGNIISSDILLQTKFFGQYFCPREYGCIFNHYYVTGP